MHERTRSTMTPFFFLCVFEYTHQEFNYDMGSELKCAPSSPHRAQATLTQRCLFSKTLYLTVRGQNPRGSHPAEVRTH